MAIVFPSESERESRQSPAPEVRREPAAVLEESGGADIRAASPVSAQAPAVAQIVRERLEAQQRQGAQRAQPEPRQPEPRQSGGTQPQKPSEAPATAEPEPEPQQPEQLPAPEQAQSEEEARLAERRLHRKPQRSRWHLGCILLKAPARPSRPGRRASEQRVNVTARGVGALRNSVGDALAQKGAESVGARAAAERPYFSKWRNAASVEPRSVSTKPPTPRHQLGTVALAITCR